MSTTRSIHEIDHGKKLVQGNPEETWGWSTPAGKVRAKRRASMIIENALLQSGIYAIEIGCGTGLFTEYFSRTGAHIVAVDISAELLEIANGRRLPKDKVVFLNKRFEDCDIDGPFDVVIGSSILHHLDLKSALEKIFELLKPGGVMCFVEPNMLNPQIMLQKKVPFIKKLLGDSPDETAFFRWPLKNTLADIGFMKTRILPVDWLHPMTPPSLIQVVGRIGEFFERIFVIREFAGSLLIVSHKPLIGQ